MGWKDISHHNNFNLEPLVPPGENGCMFKFPYKEVGRRFDLSMLDLCIFGHWSFHFSDDYVFLHPEQMEANLDPLQDKQYKGSMITKLLYKGLKNDCGKY